MLRQFNRLLALAIFVVVALYLTLTNSDTATIKIGPNISVTTYAGVIYIGVFFLGCVTASIVALFFGFKSYLRERKLRAQERYRQAFFELFIKARSYMASGELRAARDIWEQILSKDPDNVIARVELSACFEGLGDLREALRVLDETRASHVDNAEVLFRAVALNRKLGNNTAANDNLALIVAKSPSKHALELSRNIAEEMGRIEDAIEYNRELEKVGYSSEEMNEAKTRLTFAHIVQTNQSDSALREALAPFVKRNPTFAPGLQRMADLELSSGHLEEAAELLVKVAKLSNGDLQRWTAIIDLWLKTAPGDFQRRADRALAAARSATQGAHGSHRIDAEFIVAKTLLAINRAEDARALLEGLDALAEKERSPLSSAQVQTRMHLTGLCLSRLGMAKETGNLWERLVEPTLPASNTGKKPVLSDRGEPSPVLSTP